MTTTATAIVWRDQCIPRFVLGTAQLGIAGYGVANRRGCLGKADADAIVGAAWTAGCRCFDTAQGYGDSEKKLAGALRRLDPSLAEAKVITKLDPALDALDPAALSAALDRSAERFGGRPLWGVMLHRFAWLEHWNSGLGTVLGEARRSGRIRYTGVSVYEPAEALAALEHPDMDIIQVPANAWDGRLVRAGFFEKARQSGKLIFVRSVFLQGLLLLPAEEAERKVAGAGRAAGRWIERCARAGLPPLRAALGWAAGLGVPLVVGAETPRQALEIAAILARPPAVEGNLAWEEDETVLNPSKWTAGRTESQL